MEVADRKAEGRKEEVYSMRRRSMRCSLCLTDKTVRSLPLSIWPWTEQPPRRSPFGHPWLPCKVMSAAQSREGENISGRRARDSARKAGVHVLNNQRGRQERTDALTCLPLFCVLMRNFYTNTVTTLSDHTGLEPYYSH